MKVVLVHTDMADITDIFQTKTVAKLRPQFPLGIYYIAAVLEKNNIDAVVIDNHLDSLPNEQVVEKILHLEPGVVGFSVTCVNIVNADQVAEAIKKKSPETIVVYGGPQATIVPDDVIKNRFVDYLVLGEGEESFVELLNSLENGGANMADIKGIYYRSEGKPLFTGPRPLIKDLDSLPFPLRPVTEIGKYPNEGHGLIEAEPVLTMSSSRGCPYKCTFCSSSYFWRRRYRARGAKSVVDEIEYLITNYGAQGINFREDNFTVNKKRVMEFCDEMIRRKVNVKWLCESRVDNVTPELLDKMYKAGCRGVWCGVESGSQRILDFIKKGYKIDQIKTAFKLFKKFKIKAGAGFMIGFPGETMNDIQKTLTLAKKIQPDWAYFQAYVGFPRGELYDYIVENRLYDSEWNGIYKVKPDKIAMEKLPELENWLTKEFNKDKWIRGLPKGARAYVKAVKSLEPLLDRAPRTKAFLKVLKNRLFSLPTIDY